MIDVSVQKKLGAFFLEVNRRSSARKLGLLGPSGSGKTTLLHCIAGICPIDAGRIAVDELVLSETSTGWHVPPERRGVGLVFQDALLFPHRSVRSNLTYGLEAHGAGPELREVVEELGLGDLLERSPETLSGGQARRVAIGRALLSGPKLLLLDEPLTGLDRALGLRTLHFLKRVAQRFSIPFLYVSHTASDICYLCDEAWVLCGGRLTAAGSPRSVMLGADVGQAGTAEVSTVVLGRREPTGTGAAACYRVGEVCLYCSPDEVVPGGEALINIRADDVIVACDKPHRISARNVLAARISSLVLHELEAWVGLTIDSSSQEWVARLTPASVRELDVKVGDSVHLIVKAHSLRAVPTE